MGLWASSWGSAECCRAQASFGESPSRGKKKSWVVADGGGKGRTRKKKTGPLQRAEEAETRTRPLVELRWEGTTESSREEGGNEGGAGGGKKRQPEAVRRNTL